MARFCTSRAPPAGATRGLIRPFNACSQLAGRAGDRVATMREARKPFGGATDGAPQPAAENAVVGTLNENLVPRSTLAGPAGTRRGDGRRPSFRVVQRDTSRAPAERARILCPPRRGDRGRGRAARRDRPRPLRARDEGARRDGARLRRASDGAHRRSGAGAGRDRGGQRLRPDLPRPPRRQDRGRAEDTAEDTGRPLDGVHAWRCARLLGDRRGPGRSGTLRSSSTRSPS